MRVGIAPCNRPNWTVRVVTPHIPALIAILAQCRWGSTPGTSSKIGPNYAHRLFLWLLIAFSSSPGRATTDHDRLRFTRPVDHRQLLALHRDRRSAYPSGRNSSSSRYALHTRRNRPLPILASLLPSLSCNASRSLLAQPVQCQVQHIPSLPRGHQHLG